MKRQLTIALICMAVSTPALALPPEYKPPPQVLPKPITSYYEGKALRAEIALREKQAEALQAEIERNRQEAQRQDAQRQERLRLQREERERAQTESFKAQRKEDNRTAEADMYVQLRTIGQLRDDGILTDEEFEEQKKKILQAGEAEAIPRPYH